MDTENEIRDIIENLSKISMAKLSCMADDLSEPNGQFFVTNSTLESVASLGKRARVVLDAMGPITRSASSAARHDDYAGTMQLALAIEGEATLITKMETNAYLDHIPMLLAGLTAKTEEFTATAARRLGMGERQLKGVIAELVGALRKDELEETWKRVKDKIPAQIDLGDGSENPKIGQ